MKKIIFIILSILFSKTAFCTTKAPLIQYVDRLIMEQLAFECFLSKNSFQNFEQVLLELSDEYKPEFEKVVRDEADKILKLGLYKTDCGLCRNVYILPMEEILKLIETKFQDLNFKYRFIFNLTMIPDHIIEEGFLK